MCAISSLTSTFAISSPDEFLYSVTLMLNELALPRFEEIAEKYWCDLRQQIAGSDNSIVSLFSRLSVL